MTIEGNEPWRPRWLQIRSMSGGGQGDTFLAVDTESTADVTPGAVMKLLKQHKANDPKARRRMAQEVTNLKVLHSAGGNVPRVLDGNTERFEEPSVPLYFVMELIPGKTLADVIQDRAVLPLEQAVGLVLDLLATVKTAAKEGIVHRDIKPENIVVRGLEPPDAVMVDFGLSFNEDDDSKLTSADEALDNKFVTLPERRGPGENKRDFRSDLTGLCAILFYCLTGCAPRNLRDSQGRAPHRWPNFTLDQKISNPVQLAFANALLDMGLSHDIDQRFQTAEELEGRLIELLHPPTEMPTEDLEVVAARESDALRMNDREMQLSEFSGNLSSLKDRLMSYMSDFQQKLAKYKAFELQWDDLVRPTREPMGAGATTLTKGKVAVLVKHHKIRHEIAYAFIAEGLECVLYRDTNEVIERLSFHYNINIRSVHLPPGAQVQTSVVEQPTVVFRCHVGQSPDLNLWKQDIENSISKSIAALSKRVQEGYELPDTNPQPR